MVSTVESGPAFCLPDLSACVESAVRLVSPCMCALHGLFGVHAGRMYCALGHTRITRRVS
eukprot:15465493-Alexandrium_andersonii.AAC.1